MKLREPFRTWFLPEHLAGDGPGARQAARTVKIGLAMLPWVPIFVVIYSVVHAPISAAILVVAGSALLVTLRSLRWGFPVPIVANAVTGLVCLTLVALSAVTGGLSAPASRWQAVVPLLALKLGGRASGIIWTAVSLSWGALFLLIHLRFGPLPSELTGETLMVVGICGDLGMIACVAVVTWLFDMGERAAQAMLQSARSAAEAAARAKSTFLANMSHELRTPMNGIVGMTDLTLRTQLTETQRDYLQTVKSSANSLLRIVDEILDFSKIEAGRLTLDEIEFSMVTCVGEAVAMVEPLAQTKGLSISCALSGEVPNQVIGDPFRLRQVLLNLLCNAVRFTDRGRISVATEVASMSDDRVKVRFRVTDTGIGIPRDKLDAVFEAFVQADASTTRTHGGTGLGLAISSEIVELLGGEMRVSSTVGAGSCFEFTAAFQRVAGNGSEGISRTDEAPRTSRMNAAPQSTREMDAGQSAKADEKPTAGLRVLVADDNSINQRLAQIVLTQAGHSVVLATDGEEAVTQSGESEFDLILMDVSMPLLDGLDATRAIRRREVGTGQRLPIVALTANSQQEDRDQCLAAGMDGFLVKPLEPEALNAAIDRLCRSAAVASSQ